MNLLIFVTFVIQGHCHSDANKLEINKNVLYLHEQFKPLDVQ